MKFEEAIKAAAEVSRKDGKPYKLIFDGCETNLMILADKDYEDAYVRLCGAEQFYEGWSLFSLFDIQSDKWQV